LNFFRFKNLRVICMRYNVCVSKRFPEDIDLAGINEIVRTNCTQWSFFLRFLRIVIKPRIKITHERFIVFVCKFQNWTQGTDALSWSETEGFIQLWFFIFNETSIKTPGKTRVVSVTAVLHFLYRFTFIECSFAENDQKNASNDFWRSFPSLEFMSVLRKS
jgi:hypothetical protein